MNRKLPINCQLPEGFLDEEVRDGFVVTNKLKKIWAIEIDLYFQFARICEKYGIRFQLFAGSLLGAVRHRGFIPWDDDFDVAMTRDEYKKFLKVAQEELAYPYFLQTALTDRRYFFGYARLRNSETTGVISWYSSTSYNNGIYLDIYVLDGRAETAVQNFIQTKLKWIAMKLLLATARPDNTRKLACVFYDCIWPFASIIPYTLRVRFYDYVLSMYGRNPKHWNHTTHGDYTYNNITAEQWCNTQLIPFEWFEVPVPTDYDGVLKKIYGDYMKLPPVEVRGKWHESIVHFEPDVPYAEYLLKYGCAFK